MSQQLLFNTVRIETKDIEGTILGTGTSFVLLHQFAGGREELFLVTNKHVIEEGDSADVSFTRKRADGTPDIGNPFFLRIDDFQHQWHGHPDDSVDIAVLPVSRYFDLLEKNGERPYLMRVATNVIADLAFVNSADAFMPVVFVGYPNGLFDEINYTPIIRQGTTATPLQLDFSGRPVFLIDASVFPGSSGSPVFAYDLSIKGQIINVRLLGIIAEVFTQDESGVIEITPAPTNKTSIVRFNQLMDLGVVFKATLIQEAIDDFGRKHGLGSVA